MTSHSQGAAQYRHTTRCCSMTSHSRGAAQCRHTHEVLLNDVIANTTGGNRQMQMYTRVLTCEKHIDIIEERYLVTVKLIHI